MTLKLYECPNCGAKSCEQVELNIFHCNLCDSNFDVEEMGFDQPSVSAQESHLCSWCSHELHLTTDNELVCRNEACPLCSP